MERVGEGNANLFIMLREDRKTTSSNFERRMAKELREIPMRG